MRKVNIVTTVVAYFTASIFFGSTVFAQEQQSKIILSPSFQQLPVGEEFQVDVIASTTTETVGADVYIDYDPRVLEVLAVEVGEAFDLVPLKTADEGTIKITAVMEQEGGNFVGAGRVATLRMKTIDAGDTSLRVKYEDGQTTDSNIVSANVRDTLREVDEGVFLSGSAFERSFGAAKRLAIRAIPIFLFLIFAGIAAYVGYRYWQKKQSEPKDVFIPREIPMDRPPES